jgi:hypothetical protein
MVEGGVTTPLHTVAQPTIIIPEKIWKKDEAAAALAIQIA